MNPGIIYFDCAGTLLRPAEPVGDVYARTAEAFGLPCDPREVDRRFRTAWKRAARPSYPDGPDEKVDLDWWRGIVRESLSIPCPRAPGNLAGTPGGNPEISGESVVVVVDAGGHDGTDGGFDSDSDSDSDPEPGQAVPAFEKCFEALFGHYARPDAWRIYPEVLSVLEALRGKVRLGVLSNFDARLYPVLAGHGLSRFFEITVISSESAACKPDPAIFTRAAALAGLPPEACLLAGDDPVNDWQGAAAAGWRVFRLRRPENSLTGLLPWGS